ncbi:G-protein coupled receptor Mth2-like [Ischnura elegans]|uniref:G-protein coupled receptor Mth2-like n=1 Tax=Ischnura elegans TaxID=197161 RepID=UPI001ED871A0|nr:G-protein coupled receptor Mth2-like [Ischnura elegans]
MFLAFRGMLPTRRNFTQRKKFYAYMAYAWGIPFIMLLIVLFLEFYPNLPEWVLRPKFKGNCWITEASKLEYFVIPMGIIVSTNLMLFLLTARTISRAEKETQVLTKGDSRRHQQSDDKARFKLYIKLSLIMGISWISEVIYFAVGGSDCYWFLPDAVNLLQGVFIFLITTCKSNVKKLIKKRIHSIMSRERGSFLQSISSSGHTTRSSV